MALHVSGNSCNISSMFIYFLMYIPVHTWKKWQFKIFICCFSLNCCRNLYAVIYTTLMFSHQNNELLHVRDKRCLVSHWPAAFQFEFLMTTFMELRVVAGRSRRVVPWPWEVAFRTAWSEHGRGAAWAWHGVCESNTATLCKSNGKDTI